jgi:AraC family transcriptional activator of pobA
MVKTGQMASIRQMTFQPPRGLPVSVETMSFDRLRELDGGQSERGDFFVVALVESGTGSTMIDYQNMTLGPRSVVWLGPGVVHRWVDIAKLQGVIVLFTPTAPIAPSARVLTTMPGIGTAWTADEESWRLMQGAVVHLRAEFDAVAAGLESPSEILGSILSAFLLRGTPADQLDSAENTVYQQFRNAVEADLATRRDVQHYARELGYSARTISRAVEASTGQSAKAYVTERVILEAKRLLAHEGCSLKEVAQRLGFGDPSAFSAYFKRETGMTPGTWRDRAA